MYNLNIKLPPCVSEEAVETLRQQLENIPEVEDIVRCERDRAFCIEMRPVYTAILHVKRLTAKLVPTAGTRTGMPSVDVRTPANPTEAVIG